MSHSPGDKVFAKIKGFPNWPARINPLPLDVQIPKGKLPIFFYGTYQVSFVSVKNIVPYEKFKEKWGKPKPSAQFMTAMKEIEANPGIYMLGEDPRAEEFLLQFYDFKPIGSGCVRQHKRQYSRKSKVDNDQPLSITNQEASSGSRDQIDRVSDDASSDISSGPSKVDSLDPIADDSNDEMLMDNTNHHLQCSDDYQRVDMSCSNRLSPNSTIDHPSDEKDSYQEDREARRLARKLQKKAEKKALKKAAKREAKRLAKEKRAERRARREAKRELKRLHKLEKCRLTEQGSLTFDIHELDTRNSEINQESSISHAWGDNQWSPASHSEPVQTNEDSTDSSTGKPIPPTLDNGLIKQLQFERQTEEEEDEEDENDDDDDTLPTSQGDNFSPNEEIVLKDMDFSNTTTLLDYNEHENFTGNKRSRLSPNSNDCDALNGIVELGANEIIPPKKKAKTEIIVNENNDVVCHSEAKVTSSESHDRFIMGENDSQLNNEQDVQQSATIIETTATTTKKSVEVESSDNPKQTSPEQPTSETVTKHIVHSRTTSSSSSIGNKQTKSKQQRSRLRTKKPTVISLDLDDDDDEEEEANEIDSKKKVINLHDSSSSSSPSSPSALSLSNDSDAENAKIKDKQQLSSKLKEKSRNSSPPKSSIVINKSNQLKKSRNQESNKKTRNTTTTNNNNNNLKGKSKSTESKSTAASNTGAVGVHDEKRLSNDSSSNRPVPAPSIDPVSQLHQCCRDLKTSLIKGHENFVEAVQLLNKVRTIPVRLPQLAEAWDLMDCIKKCRRYKLSSEVREAAQTTFQFFQSLQANTTKEELSQAQALIASHQSRIHSSQDSTVDNTAKTDAAPPTSTEINNKQTLQNDTNTNDSNNNNNSESTSNPTTTTTTNEHESLTADLEAKVDDVLSRIRATEERMAAAAIASARPDTPYKSISSHVTNSAIRSTGGRIIRASAVAAATAHMHDEEDEESVMSRVEQVAAYEASTIQHYSNSSTSLGSPPPPPPPPPPLPLSSVGSSDRIEPQTSPNVDHLDLDSRIQLFMSATSSKKPVKPSDSNPVMVTTNKPEITPPIKSHPNQSNVTNVTSSFSSSTTTASTTTSSSFGSSTTSSLLPALLAKRKVIADKLAAVRAAGGSPIKSCHPVTSPLPSPTTTSSNNNEVYIVEKLSSTTPIHTSSHNSTKLLNSTKMPSKDEELYDLLGV
ncbi:unnamed protein product [Schistosoma turkestanicum]|nr:unnamed protein product [Schistosoma turkestanicum]